MEVSVIVPVYNGRDYIESCCRQLAGQTLKGLEFILINDGSTDGSDVICSRMAERYPNCRVLQQENQGVSAARNNGILLARGEYIGFVDVDDEIDSDLFETLYRAAAGGKLDVVSMEQFGQPGELSVMTRREDWMKLFFSARIRIPVWNKLVRSSLLEQPLFPVGKRIHEDLWATYQMLLRADRVGILNENKYHHILREGSSSRTMVFHEKFFDAVEIADWVYADAKDRFPGLSDLNEGRKAKTYLIISKTYYRRKAPKVYRSRILEMKEYLKSLDQSKLRRCFKRSEWIRYQLYLHAMPVFRLLVLTIDKK